MGLEENQKVILIKTIMTLNMLLLPIMFIFDKWVYTLKITLLILLLWLLPLVIFTIYIHKNKKKNVYYQDSQAYKWISGFVIIISQLYILSKGSERLAGILYSSLLIGDYLHFILIYNRRRLK